MAEITVRAERNEQGIRWWTLNCSKCLTELLTNDDEAFVRFIERHAYGHEEEPS